MKIYHNPRCRKSRETLQLIHDSGITPEIIEYLNEPPTAEEFDAILKKLKLEPQAVMRKGEAVYKELKLKDRDLSRDEAIQVMVENPKLIERPIVIKGRKAILGRPPENVNELL
ncbi:MAG: arsenate reductase (glutaredoxin) [Planctomycetaceae bacterium]|jgi:arsenate reductase (glutaredoxin)|nr:arsenate reductase (glutaredoxin) [bacterium]MDB4679566.1 arsenate reductase (glutaredoxin) [Planctomycetaceae bacterium]MDG2390574.1 arsenate reductase (glutaredoxin) [Planctomycetaceae bacterium]